MKKLNCLILLSFICITSLQGQSARKLLMEGDFFFGMGNLEEAEKYYEKSSAKKPSFQSFYNTGVSQEHQIPTGETQTAEQTLQQPEEDPNEAEAIDSYLEAMAYTSSDELKSRALYNKANTSLRNQQTITIEKLEQAVVSFKDAIRIDPGNKRARHNLAIVQAQLDQLKQQEQQQQQQQEQQDQEQEKQDQQDQENSDQQDQENQDQEQENEEEQDQENQDKEKEQQEEKEQNEEANRKEQEEISKNEMKKLLEMIEQQDQKTQQKVRTRAQSQATEKKKKW